MFSRLFHSHKMYLFDSPFGPFSTWMTDFPSCTSTSKIATLSYTWRLKLVPLSGCIGYYREYPPPPLVKCMTHWWDCLACSSTHSSRGGEWYLERRRSRKILTGSRNLGSVFDKSRSLVFAWFVFTFFEFRNFLPKSLGLGFLTRVSASRRVSDFTIRHPFKSVFHLRPSRGCKLVWFETEIGGWTNPIHITTSELILTPRKVSSAHLSSLEPLSLELKAWRQCCGESVFLSWQGNSLEKKKFLSFCRSKYKFQIDAKEMTNRETYVWRTK